MAKRANVKQFQKGPEALGKAIEPKLANTGDNLAQGDGIEYFTIPSFLDGAKLSRAQAQINGTAGSGSGNTTIQVYNVTKAVDMLTTPITIATAGLVGTPGVIDAANNTVNTDDLIRLDVDSLPSTPPKGCIGMLEFSH